jgi:hypothetical protein
LTTGLSLEQHIPKMAFSDTLKKLDSHSSVSEELRVYTVQGAALSVITVVGECCAGRSHDRCAIVSVSTYTNNAFTSSPFDINSHIVLGIDGN